MTESGHIFPRVEFISTLKVTAGVAVVSPQKTYYLRQKHFRFLPNYRSASKLCLTVRCGVLGTNGQVPADSPETPTAFSSQTRQLV